MFRLGVIEESLENLDTLGLLKPFFFSQRIEVFTRPFYNNLIELLCIDQIKLN